MACTIDCDLPQSNSSSIMNTAEYSSRSTGTLKADPAEALLLERELAGLTAVNLPVNRALPSK